MHREVFACWAPCSWKLITTAPNFGENDGVTLLDRKTWLFCHWAGGLLVTTDQGVNWKNVAPSGGNRIPKGSPD